MSGRGWEGQATGFVGEMRVLGSNAARASLALGTDGQSAVTVVNNRTGERLRVWDGEVEKRDCRQKTIPGWAPFTSTLGT